MDPLCDDVIHLLRSVAPEFNVHTYRHLFISTAVVARAFIWFRVLWRVEQNPWKLARGDVLANLNHLVSLDEAPAEEVASKCYNALKDHAAPRARIIEGVEMLQHVSHSIRICEQLHTVA